MSLNVIALGGNAILDTDPTDEGQKAVVNHAAKYIAEFVAKGEQVIVCHGNGPQVGNLLLQQKAGESEKNPALKLDTCVAMTQGSIGYWLQNALTNEFEKRNIAKPVISVVTQVRVDKEDPSFKKPSKPIGPFYTKEEADAEAAKDGSTYVEDAGRGYRKVVPSPMPKEIVEKEAVRALVEADVLTICSGGGGIPVVAEGGQYVGVEAVNDKDFSARVLAENVDADRLIILTGVDNIYINYNQPDQKALEQISVAEAEEYIKEGHFAAGSMLPKIEAALDFVKGDDKRKAIITSIENLENIDKEAGTVISQKG
ncbi:carbamate kinase [Enterococcus faecalis]|uniref:carbamate kinase n=1 Tax=Enterococcus faecalis TaxID=1351 RepID=UPI0001B2E65C|nr:carbamate kinase [Enterococcus faecalis]EEU78803.1 carbamate kinase [Enterococcus faecalis Fly1]EGO2631789.1 carbamate kinase [Enterococcus faecalis]EGO7617534.1 carbamate kinase [Enterococcus faecalis]EGO7912367.1 carbamate kinase [Enterococcus faecalis]EHU8863097.1 carbamate kinase [Enterococcus faecalis]